MEANATLGMQRHRLRRFWVRTPRTEYREHTGHEQEGSLREGGVGAINLHFMWSAWVEDKEKDRMTELEWMDEVEEWILLMKHYCVVWGWRDRGGKGEIASLVFDGWRGVPNQAGATLDRGVGTACGREWDERP